MPVFPRSEGNREILTLLEHLKCFLQCAVGQKQDTVLVLASKGGLGIQGKRFPSEPQRST